MTSDRAAGESRLERPLPAIVAEAKGIILVLRLFLRLFDIHGGACYRGK